MFTRHLLTYPSTFGALKCPRSVSRKILRWSDKRFFRIGCHQSVTTRMQWALWLCSIITPRGYVINIAHRRWGLILTCRFFFIVPRVPKCKMLNFDECAWSYTMKAQFIFFIFFKADIKVDTVSYPESYSRRCNPKSSTNVTPFKNICVKVKIIRGVNS